MIFLFHFVCENSFFPQPTYQLNDKGAVFWSPYMVSGACYFKELIIKILYFEDFQLASSLSHLILGVRTQK